jgi:putative transcriptional regulator
MVQHDKQGALGLVLNHPIETTIKQAWEQIKGQGCERGDLLYVGGPCQGVLMALHTQQEVSQIEVFPGLHFSTEADKLEYLVEQGDPQMRFFVGYSGWGPGQLEKELEAGSWITAPATIEQVFSTDQRQWLQISRDISWAAISGGLNPKLIPEDPSMN